MSPRWRGWELRSRRLRAMSPTPANTNEPHPGSLDGLRQRKARFLAEAAAAKNEFDAGVAEAGAEMTAMVAAKIWGEVI